MDKLKFKNTQPNPNFEGVLDVSVDDVHQLANQLVLVDVRQPDEYTGELGHIQNSQLIVLDTLPDHLENLPQDKPVVFVCRSGGRSAKAAAFAQMQGYGQVYNMQGGMLEWNKQQLPVER